MDATSSPDMSFFERFSENCEKLNKKVFMTGNNEVPNDVCSTI